MAKNLFARYLWELQTIYRAGYITLRELNERWEGCWLYDDKPIPRRTWDNHRREIEMIFDVNIECRKSDNTYFIEDDESLTTGKMTRDLINMFSVNMMLGEARELKQRVVYEDVPSGQHHLTTIIQAMRENKKLAMEYKTFTASHSIAISLEPYFLKIFKQRWYVVGYCSDVDDIRIYSLDRIVSLAITDVGFKYPRDIDPAGYFAGCYGIVRNVDVAIETVLVRTLGNQHQYLLTLPLHESQRLVEQNGAECVFEYRVKPTFDFRQALLQHGANVEVLSPEWLREEMKQIVNEMQQLYDK